MYISRAVSNFYGTDIEISAGWGQVGNIEKNGPIEGVFFFIFSWAKENLLIV